MRGAKRLTTALPAMLPTPHKAPNTSTNEIVAFCNCSEVMRFMFGWVRRTPALRPGLDVKLHQSLAGESRPLTSLYHISQIITILILISNPFTTLGASFLFIVASSVLLLVAEKKLPRKIVPRWFPKPVVQIVIKFVDVHPRFFWPGQLTQGWRRGSGREFLCTLDVRHAATRGCDDVQAVTLGHDTLACAHGESLSLRPRTLLVQRSWNC